MGIENVVRLADNANPKFVGGAEFPAMLWSEKTGESRLFKSAGEVPEGYLPFHLDDAEKMAAYKAARAPKPAAKPNMTRKEIVKALVDGGIEFTATAEHADLYDLLLTGVKNALAEAHIEYDSASTDAKALLGLFPSS